LIERARLFGYDGIEIDGKRPHGNPLDMDSATCLEVRRAAADAGVPIYAVAANNDFSSPVPEHHESQLAYVRDLIRMTADLGATTLRVFAAWPGVTTSAAGGRYDVAERIWEQTHAGIDPEQTWEWCRSGLAESARRAADAGIVLALQNHPPVVSNYQDMLRMAAEVASSALKVCFDAPLARKQGVGDMQQAAAEVGPLQTLTHFGGEYTLAPEGEVLGFVRARDGRLAPEDFYGSFATGMIDIGYEGHTGYELCHPIPPVDGAPVGIDFVDKNARLAAIFMRKVIAEARAAASRTKIRKEETGPPGISL